MDLMLIGNPPEDSRPCQHVLMVWRSDGKDQRHETMDERLSCLAQRLQQLKQRSSPQPHEIGPSCGGVGSSPTGMAMWWNAQGGQREVQPVRNMAELHTLRVTPALCEQGVLPGDTRAVGPPTDLVMEAQLELQNDFEPRQMTEKIFNGKLMEIKGRHLVMSGGRGRMSVQVRADERLGRWMMGETEEEEKTVTKPKPMTKAKAKATSTPPPREFSPAPRTPGQGSRSSSKEDAIPPGSTVDKRSPQKPVKIKKEPAEQSVPVTAPLTPAGAQSVLVMVDSDVEVISNSEEDKDKAENKGD